jgi:hypothetical protein
MKKKGSSKGKLWVARIFFWGLVSFLFLVFARYFIVNALLKESGKCIKGVLYGETYGVKTGYSLKYRFYINSKRYTGFIKEDESVKIGDSICVVYIEVFPSENRPIQFFDNGQIKCNCELINP